MAHNIALLLHSFSENLWYDYNVELSEEPGSGLFLLNIVEKGNKFYNTTKKRNKLVFWCIQCKVDMLNYGCD